MFYKHVMRNRSLAAWLGGGAMLCNGECSGLGIAASILEAVASGLWWFS